MAVAMLRQSSLIQLVMAAKKALASSRVSARGGVTSTPFRFLAFRRQRVVAKWRA
jgi:hypothetical protein